MGIAGLLRGRLVVLAAQRELRRWQCSGRVQAPTVNKILHSCLKSARLRLLLHLKSHAGKLTKLFEARSRGPPQR
jgi:hypothetical protein